MTFPKAIIDAANFSFRYRPMFEAAAIALVMMVGTAFAVSQFQGLVARSQLAESLSLFSTLKAEITAFHSENGRWPETDAEKAGVGMEPGEYFLGSYVRRMEIREDGLIVAVMGSADSVSAAIADTSLAFRPFLNPAESGAPIVWTCGTWNAPATLTTTVPNPTTVDAHILSYQCRQQASQ